MVRQDVRKVFGKVGARNPCPRAVSRLRLIPAAGEEHIVIPRFHVPEDIAGCAGDVGKLSFGIGEKRGGPLVWISSAGTVLTKTAAGGAAGAPHRWNGREDVFQSARI